TWNSGISRVPYINLYHDNVNHTSTVPEVSVDRSTEQLIRRSPRNRFIPLSVEESKVRSNNSLPAVAKSSEKPVRSNQRPSKIFGNEDRNDSPRLRHFFRRTKGPSVLRNFTSKSGHELGQVRSLGPKVSKRFDGSAGDGGSPRRTEIVLDNSPKAPTSARDPGFPDRAAEIALANRAEVEPAIEFDHVAAIRKITDSLTQQNAGKPSSKAGDRVVSAVQSAASPAPPPRASIRRSKPPNSKNRIKVRPHSSQSKKGASKHGSKVRNKSNASRPLHWKNWPNGAIQTASDYQNYEKYTSLVEDLKPEETVKQPVSQLASNHLVPVASPDLQEIVHWLKIPAFVTNGSHILESNEANGPVSVVFDPVYQNLQPNKPSRPSTVQSFGPNPVYTLAPRPVYTTERPSGWLGNASLRNKTQSSSQSQISQVNVLHISNSDSRKPNKTVVATRRPGSNGRPGSLASPAIEPYSSSVGPTQLAPSPTAKPGPNVHIGFTSHEEETKVPNQQAELQPPLVTYDQRCPTILINSYTRINNTVQSKDGCTDLNIIINSHVFNSNTYKPTPPPLDQVDENLESIDKYDSGLPVYQADSQESHGPLKDPVTSVSEGTDGSNLQVYQGTHISILGSGPASEATPVEPPEQTNELSNDNPDTSVASPDVEAAGESSDDPGVQSVAQPEGEALNSQSSGSSSAAPTSLTATSSPASSQSDDDDDDDDLDLSPTGIMESIASVFAYFTYVNPLHYGFFSIAAAPFTALAAGILGMVTFAFPWLFPSSFGFRRSNNDAVEFWRNVEDVIGQSMEKYGRLNEWKSRKKKRKR
ncbi:uncharacterized protein LOC143260818, partial [Megalopta genalis]|uniref:uncharacterized protein LOC143260818 n=1 Tax=Megalopta genalis TaxID=115081 RepID=UPI003FD5CC15